MTEKKWYEIYPKNVSKNDLIGKVLKLDSETPPQNTDKDFLKDLTVVELTDNRNKYIVRVTLRDIQTMIDLIPKAFSFAKKKPDDAWASVIEA